MCSLKKCILSQILGGQTGPSKWKTSASNGWTITTCLDPSKHRPLMLCASQVVSKNSVQCPQFIFTSSTVLIVCEGVWLHSSLCFNTPEMRRLFLCHHVSLKKIGFLITFDNFDHQLSKANLSHISGSIDRSIYLSIYLSIWSRKMCVPIYIYIYKVVPPQL